MEGAAVRAQSPPFSASPICTWSRASTGSFVGRVALREQPEAEHGPIERQSRYKVPDRRLMVSP